MLTQQQQQPAESKSNSNTMEGDNTHVDAAILLREQNDDLVREPEQVKLEQQETMPQPDFLYVVTLMAQQI